MKRSKQWAVTLALLPAIYLASCGSGNNEKDRQDKITTQSPPPAATAVNPPPADGYNSYDSSSNITGAGNEVAATKAPSNTSATAKTETDNEARSKTSATVKSETKKPTTYHRRTYAARTSSFSKKKSSKPVDLPKATTSEKTGATELERITDTAASKLRKLGDSTAKKIQEITDTAAKKMDRLADTTAHHLQNLGDSSTISHHNMMSGDSSTRTMMDTTGKNTGHWPADVSGKKSTTDTGINFSSTVFIPDQIRSNYAEIKMARMAIDKSQNDAVKQVATTLENDHNSLLRELQTMARNSVNGADSIPTSENEMARQHMDMLKNLTGQEFDRQWLMHMHMMHDQKIQMFEQAESNNSIHDAELRIWVEKTLPTLRKHREMLAQTLNAISK